MTELATTEPAAIEQQAAPITPTAGTTALMAWAQEADLAYQMAQKLANTSFVPATMRGKPGEITAAILAGAELGLKPMAALKSIDIIQGVYALRAHALRAVVQNQGHEIELVESRPDYCKMRGRRSGAAEWQTVEWTIQRAGQMKLTEKAEWKKQPQTMLVARATGEICRLIASDALHGMPYVAEELEGTVHAEVVPQAAPLSIAAVTGPSVMPVAPAPADTEYAVTRDDEGTPEWEEVEGSTDWPAVSQPGGEA
ncbi:hypothetical protein [Streptomyces filamentosus]|uniref:hypothetical protein n=1 Tax=Streptomyces filamentosus TaxID=67294 RepID=UPI00123A6B2A|nr:hypothetical protein [Streptomyces filamentosus]KAA6211754.1 hypothetical protein CP979_35875 [Streptomyces filamentosus]KAA6220038.1 hypothetical protein CP979_26440 [Streptomyces filamentosus]